MLGISLFIVFILIEISFTVIGVRNKENLKKEKSISRIALTLIFILLVLFKVIKWGFQWYGLGLFLIIQSLLGIMVLVNHKRNIKIKNMKNIFMFVRRSVLITFVFIPILIFPQYRPIETTGDYKVDTVSYTLTDESREETFTKTEGDKRQLTFQCWYPNQTKSTEKYPLVIFSHGAFGYRMSNYSTFMELASNGYVVCSIDHTHHSFMTKDTNGNVVIGNTDFMNSAMGAQMGDLSTEKVYQIQQEWMDLRTADMAFVLNYIHVMTSTNQPDPVFTTMDLEHIGLMGHSLGGATAAEMGRVDDRIDAVIVIDGTMLGEVNGFENGKEIVTNDPYKKPLMNIYNESHYNEALKLKDDYPNMVAYKNAVDAYQVVIKGSGHMNYTDLPIVSPFLSNLLETEKNVTVNPRYCIETTNQVVLEFFNHYLKSDPNEIQKERVFGK